MSSNNVEQIKARLSIVDVVSSYVKLEKAGKNYKARCPFHNEKTPSFFVSPDRETYHCFGCGVGGDIFSFIEKIEGVEFKEALKTLADRAGVVLAFENQKEARGRDRLYEAMEHAASFFENELSKNEHVKAYLYGRGVEEPTFEVFRIGYISPEWNLLVTHMSGLGFSSQELLHAGLVLEKNGRLYDRFRGRIMFPIVDHTGRICAFSGRIFGDDDPHTGKYINSPETPLFHKSDVLYGFYNAKNAIRTENACILVEGQMDVILSHQARVLNTVAASGTALTDEHVTRLARLADTLVLAFDADEAGIRASRRSIDTALEHGMDVKVVSLPIGTDPAEYIQKDPLGWKKRVEEATHIIYFLLAVVEETEKDLRMRRKRAEELIVPYLVRMKSRVDQAHFIGEIATALGIPEEPLWETLREYQATHHGRTPPVSIEGESPVSSVTGRSRQETIVARVAALVRWRDAGAKGDTPLMQRCMEKIETLYGENLSSLVRRIDPRYMEKLLFEIERTPPPSFEEELEELVFHLEEYIARKRLWKASNDLKYAEQKGNDALIKEKLEECTRCSRDLDLISQRKKEKEEW